MGVAGLFLGRRIGHGADAEALANENDAPDLMAYAIDLERRALGAIKPGLSVLPDEPVKSP